MKLKKTFLMIFIFSIFLISLTFVSAQPPSTQVQQFPEGYVIVESPHLYLKQNQDYQYNFFVYNTSNGLLIDNTSIICNFFLANSSGEVIYFSEVDYFVDRYWGIDILGGNFSETGSYPYGVSCQDGNGGSLAGIFEISPTGTTIEQKDLFSRIFLIIFIIFLGFIVAGFKKGVDLDRWNDKLRTRYENRNYVKFVFGSLWYNILKNNYVIYYLLGLFLVTLLYDIGFIFNIESMYQTLEILLSIYIWGLVLLGIVFFSHVQEWFVDLLKQLEDNSWGMGK